MDQRLRKLPTVQATVTEVMPLFGLAYLSGDDARAWTVTKSTPGAGLHALRPGMRVDLQVSRHSDFSVVPDTPRWTEARTLPLHQAAKSVANTTAAGVAISAIAAHPIMRRCPAIFSQLFTRLGGPIHKITTAVGSSSMMLVRAPDAEPMWSYGDRLLASRFYLKPGKRIAS